VHATFAGLNHLCWLLDLRRGSEDLYPRLRALVSDALPWGLQGGRDMTMEYISAKRELWDRLHGQADGVLPLDGIEKQEAERLVTIAAAITTGRDTVELAVNLPNQGKISNLPPEAVVEVPAVAGPAGVTGLAVGPLPEAIAAVLTARVQQQELTVRAALDRFSVRGSAA
jgi:alpha-galactosidase